MASGFQQNENQLTPGLYRVEIDLTTSYSSTAADTDAGSVETRDNSVFATQNTSLANTLLSLVSTLYLQHKTLHWPTVNAEPEAIYAGKVSWKH